MSNHPGYPTWHSSAQNARRVPRDFDRSLARLSDNSELKDYEKIQKSDVLPSQLFIHNVRLPHADPALAARLWRVECLGDQVLEVSPSDEAEEPPIPNRPKGTWSDIDAGGSIMLPSLCHSHIHLDKCFILDRCDELVTGDFDEAMKVTAKAKAKFSLDKDDLLLRGRRLVRESIDCGVTSMRAHVEVDSIVRFSCLEVASRLKEEFKMLCEIQIAVFAQEPLFTDTDDAQPGQNYALLREAIRRHGVEVVGSAPYVEATVELAKKNIALILELAGCNGYHADFHLDYNLDPHSEPLIYEVISQAKALSRYWRPTGGLAPRRITIGHATRMQLFTPAQWRDIADAVDDLPIVLVGLPNSDMYMQGREDTDLLLGPPRSTLRVPYIARKYGFQIAMSVNNVENAFTPQGSLDPLALCTLGAGIFQSATPQDIRTLMRSVTLTSKLAMGQTHLPVGLFPTKGDPADFVIVHGTQTLAQAVLNPSYDRTTIRNGIVVASRRTEKWIRRTEPVTLAPIILPWYQRVRWWFLLFPPLFLFQLIMGRAIKPPKKYPKLEDGAPAWERAAEEDNTIWMSSRSGK